MTTLISLAGHLAGAWATATELAPLLLVPALIWCIRTGIELADAIARAAQLTYAAGHAAGRVWFRYGLPALLATADAVSWLVSQIDWAEVAAIVRQGLMIVLATAITTAQLALPTLVRLSAALGRRYACDVNREIAAIEAAGEKLDETDGGPAPGPIRSLSQQPWLGLHAYGVS